MRQIKLKDYAQRFTLYNLPLVKVGISFDNEKHTLKDWEIKE